ncbi:unnamed protein product [Ectocarpus sp. CCAP 1310/34]|nr:unnamed protein product [Ectocarpus sp. CCAP 1310/34]
MPVRCVSTALKLCARSSKVLFQGKRSLREHGRLSPASSLLSQAPATMQGRTFSGSASGPGEAAAAVDMAKQGGDFPWRGAPNLIPEPAGSGSFLDGIMESIFEDFCLKGVDFTAGAEAAFVTTAAALFKMRTLQVRAPKPSVETAAAGVDGASKGDAEEDPASDAAEKDEAEAEKSAETSEEEAERVLAAVDKGLIALSSDKGGVPYYRLHRVVAKAIRRKKFILGVQRGDDLSGRFTVTMSPSLEFVLQENNAFAQIRNVLAGNATVTFQVDVDLACDETFYVKDKGTGEIIQGKKESSGRIHRIRLESCLLMEHAIEQPHIWKVIDLDDWLKGNAFC